ncbi:MAG: hypothetical protein R6U78_10895 [Bacteroidales bacterium]
MRIIAHTLLGLTFFWVTAEVSSQTALPDTTFSHYDSIQDQRLERVRERTGFRINRLEAEKAALGRTVDSLLEVRDSLREVQDSLQEDLLRLEQNYRELSEQVLQLQQQLDRSGETSAAYREKLRRNLWLAGTLMLLLFTGLFVYMYLYSVRMHNVFRRQLGSLRTETEKAVRKVRKRQKKMEKRTRKDLNKKIRSVRSRLKAR